MIQNNVRFFCPLSGTKTETNNAPLWTPPASVRDGNGLLSVFRVATTRRAVRFRTTRDAAPRPPARLSSRPSTAGRLRPLGLPDPRDPRTLAFEKPPVSVRLHERESAESRAAARAWPSAARAPPPRRVRRCAAPRRSARCAGWRPGRSRPPPSPGPGVPTPSSPPLGPSVGIVFIPDSAFSPRGRLPEASRRRRRPPASSARPRASSPAEGREARARGAWCGCRPPRAWAEAREAEPSRPQPGREPEPARPRRPAAAAVHCSTRNDNNNTRSNSSIIIIINNNSNNNIIIIIINNNNNNSSSRVSTPSAATTTPFDAEPIGRPRRGVYRVRPARLLRLRGVQVQGGV